MNERLIGILLESGISMLAGIFLAYLGFVSPVFGRGNEQLAPDRWVGTFRIIARIVGPILCLFAGLKIYHDLHQENTAAALKWREFTSDEGRFRVSGPSEFVKEVKEIKYGDVSISESDFKALVPKLAVFIGYIDPPASMLQIDANELLQRELYERVKATRVELLGKESIRFAGFPAVRYKLHYMSGGYFVEGILLLAKQRRYQLAVEFTSESSQQSCEQFFNSFQVLDGP